MSVEKKLRKLRGKRTLEILVNSQHEKFSSEFCGKCGIRVECTVTPLLMEGFPSNLNDTFTSTRGCAEPMLPICQLKVKVTVKGQIFNKQILHIMSCPLYTVHSTRISHFPQNSEENSSFARKPTEDIILVIHKILRSSTELIKFLGGNLEQ